MAVFLIGNCRWPPLLLQPLPSLHWFCQGFPVLFLLLLLGNYESTIAALNSFDLGYLASFAGGALVGLVTIVFVVKWCLDRFPKATYLFMAGLMFGSLEGLFPEPDPELVEYFAVVPPAFLGIAVVVGFIFLDRRMNFSSTEG